jgi:hypothetical protein
MLELFLWDSQLADKSISSRFTHLNWTTKIGYRVLVLWTSYCISHCCLEIQSHAVKMLSNSETIEKLKRRLMDSWSFSDENEVEASYLDSRNEELNTPPSSTWQNINSATRSSRIRDSSSDEMVGISPFKLTPSGKSLGKQALNHSQLPVTRNRTDSFWTRTRSLMV